MVVWLSTLESIAQITTKNNNGVGAFLPPEPFRDPASAPRELLDELADRAGIAGEPALHRISDLLAGLEAPAQVFTERGTWVHGNARARVEGEWLTTNVTDPDLLAALCWWATRQNARSVQVRG